jgi:hypothetical protein
MEVGGADIRATIRPGIPNRVTLSDDTSVPASDFESTKPQKTIMGL